MKTRILICTLLVVLVASIPAAQAQKASFASSRFSDAGSRTTGYRHAYYSESLGAEFEFVTTRTGQVYAAKIVSEPDASSPLLSLRLGMGDLIGRLDGLPVRSTLDLEGYSGDTPIEYIFAGSKRVQHGAIYISRRALRETVDPNSRRKVDRFERDARGKLVRVTGVEWTSNGVPHFEISRETTGTNRDGDTVVDVTRRVGASARD